MYPVGTANALDVFGVDDLESVPVALERNRPPVEEGWASWEDWFAVAGRPDGAPRRIGFDSYTYVLEAAAAGHGLALSWRRYIERPLDAGALVALGDGFVEFDGDCCVLTEKGRRKPLARTCLAFFDRFG